MLQRINDEPVLKIYEKTQLSINNSCELKNNLEQILYIRTNIIICPYYLIYQWITYIGKYTQLTYYTISNIKSINHIIKYGIKILDNYSIILVSCRFYNTFIKY